MKERAVDLSREALVHPFRMGWEAACRLKAARFVSTLLCLMLTFGSNEMVGCLLGSLLVCLR